VQLNPVQPLVVNWLHQANVLLIQEIQNKSLKVIPITNYRYKGLSPGRINKETSSIDTSVEIGEPERQVRKALHCGSKQQ